MNFIDLCAGIGGIRLGLEQAGHKCVGFCEFDKFALQSYKAIHNTEGEAEFHDITKVTDDQIRELAESRRIDIIAGGFPCQAFSVAGKRQGFDDTRGTIFFEIARFIKIIKPRYFICENVKGLFSHDSGRTFRTILGAMAELGYCVEWQILNSKDFGVPQNRERIFIVGHLGAGSGRKVFPIFPTDGENHCQLQEITQGMSMGQRVYDPAGLSKTLAAVGGGQGAKTGLYVQPLLCTVDKDFGVTGGMGSIKLKNIGADCANTLSARYYKGIHSNNCNAVLTGVIVEKENTKEVNQACTLDANYYKGLGCNQARTGVLVAPVLTPDREEKRQNGRRMKEPGEPAFCLNTQDRHGVAIYEEPKLIDVYNNRVLTSGICRTLTAHGNASPTTCGTFGVVVGGDQEPKIIDAIYNNRPPRVTDECPTLRSERQGLLVKEATKQGYAEAFEGDSVNLEQPNSETRRGRVGKQIANTLLCNGQMGVVAPGVRIRKLTPRECWRLQGFPDDYFDRAKAAGVSDSQLYKQAGNAVTVNVAAVIGRKLAEISAESCAVESEQNHIEASPSTIMRRIKPSTRIRARRAWR